MSVSQDIYQRRRVRLAGGSKATRKITPSTDDAVVSLSLLSEMLLFGEAAIVFLAAIMAKLLYINGFLHSSQATFGYAGIGVVGAVTALIVFRRAGLYEPERLLRHSIEARKFLSSLCLTMLLLLSMLYLLKVSEQYSRGWMVTWFVLAYLGLLSERMILRRFTRALVAKGRFVQRIAICGTGRIGKGVRDYLASNPNIRIVGFFDDSCDEVHRYEGESDGGLDDLIALGQKNMIDRIIIALPSDETDRVNSILDKLSILPKEISLCPFGKLPCLSRTIHNIGLLPMFELLSPPLSDQDYLLKTLVDYMLGVIALITLLPIFAIIAVAIKIDSKGPVVFLQRRNGYNHKVIQIYKFRTMTVCEDARVVEQAKKNDTRVTRVGKFLRRTSLDELPQLFNVMKGEMSLVGPRPHAIAHNDFYRNRVKRYGNRLRVKPGITGWAQVNGYRGETAEIELMSKRIQYDLWYIKNWSVQLDIEIMLRTLLVGFVNPKAY